MKIVAMLGTLLTLCLGCSLPVFPQSTGPTIQQAGDCAVNISGHDSTASLTCTGVDANIAKQIQALVRGMQRNDSAVKEISEKLDRILSLPVLSTQLEQLRELEKLFAGKNEVDLDTQFDFPNLEEMNIRMIRDRIIHVQKTGDKTNFDLTPYINGGSELLATDIAGDTLVHTSAGGVFRPDFSRVAMIVLTAKYLNALKQLNYYEDSITIPKDVVVAIKDLDATVQKNARTLLDTLDSALQENQEYFLDGQMPPMGVIHERFVHSQIELKPKVDAILNASRKYLRADSANP
jgi:hypothetical protein